MKGLLNLPWGALALSAITSQHHLALAFPAGSAGPVGTAAGHTAASIAQQPRSGSGSGSIVPNNNNGPSSLNVTDSTGFPPGPCPPDVVTYYTVPHSEPAVTLRFYQFDPSAHPAPWRPQRGRDETAVTIMLEGIVRAYSVPAYIHVEMTDPEYEWDEGPAPKSYVYMRPRVREEGDPPEWVLTEGVWADTVRGFQDFLRAYPGLAFRFESFVTYRPEHQFFAAGGHLSMDAQQRVDVT